MNRKPSKPDISSIRVTNARVNAMRQELKFLRELHSNIHYQCLEIAERISTLTTIIDNEVESVREMEGKP